MSVVQPRMVVAYHFFKAYDTTAGVNDPIRATYDGPLSLAEDFMVGNVTADEIGMPMAVASEEGWPPPATEKTEPSKPENRIPYSDLISGGRLDMKDAIQPVYDEIDKEHGLNEKQQ
ncbi:MAG: hypothetical protein WCE62_01930 [Polyangiales bacterium]